MIKINKVNEPKEWTQYKSTPGAKYEAIPQLVDSLLREQGYICAYCMRRIPHKDMENGKLTQEDHRIEHVKSRESYPELQLDYNNMVICCPGHIGEESHCDKKKDRDSISFTPLEQAFIDTIIYNTNGEISSTNPIYNNEMNSKLNLNTKLLVCNRRTVLSEVIQQINSQQKGKPWTAGVLRQYILKYSSMHSRDGKMQYIPYCGIILHYLNKKLSQM